MRHRAAYLERYVVRGLNLNLRECHIRAAWRVPGGSCETRGCPGRRSEGWHDPKEVGRSEKRHSALLLLRLRLQLCHGRDDNGKEQDLAIND